MKASCPTRKSWREKLADDKDLPKVVKLPAAAQKRWGGRTMVIAAPREVDALIRTIRKGRVATINELRAALRSNTGPKRPVPLPPAFSVGSRRTPPPRTRRRVANASRRGGAC